MKKTNRKVEEFIRVDHAGERGAVKIYEGQLLALNTIVKNDDLKKTIEDMKEHEIEHCQFFENEIKKRNIKPTKFLPLCRPAVSGQHIEHYSRHFLYICKCYKIKIITFHSPK